MSSSGAAPSQEAVNVSSESDKRNVCRSTQNWSVFTTAEWVVMSSMCSSVSQLHWMWQCQAIVCSRHVGRWKELYDIGFNTHVAAHDSYLPCILTRNYINPNPTKIQQTGISVGACSFSFWWRNQPNTYPGRNILHPGVADCRGLVAWRGWYSLGMQKVRGSSHKSTKAKFPSKWHEVPELSLSSLRTEKIHVVVNEL